MAFARLLESKTHLVPGKLKVSELLFEVPKDYSNLALGTLQIFARSVTRHETPAAFLSDEETRKKAQKPWLVFLQGGPGGSCRPPQDFAPTSTILDRGYQMLFLDQRGTGLSTPISAATLALQGDIRRQADYLKLFRADSIVKDCEAIRRTLTADYPNELKKWSLLGQSFGGFCVLTYLSFYPEGVREAFTTGGLAPIARTADEVYQATYKKVIERNQAYYSKYPEDVETIHNLAFYIKNKGGLQLPSGGTLTVRVLLTLYVYIQDRPRSTNLPETELQANEHSGLNFGAHGGLEVVHDHILRMKTDLSQFKFITRPTLSALELSLSFDDRVLYAILHEPCYNQGAASNWSAERVGRSLREFQWLSTAPQPDSLRKSPLYFAGEMIFPFLFDNFPELDKLSQVAQALAEFKAWPQLYDVRQLARNEVPLYAATFVDDMYVDFGFAQETASMVKGCKQFITNSMYHDALRSKTDDVLKELFKLRDDPID